jgi:DNA-directed RNA polymerase specialized sigma subunit
LSSLNTPRPGQESGEQLDQLVGDVDDSLLSDLIAEEESQTRQTQQSQINTVLISALAKLDSQVQQLLELYYAQGLTQQEMAERLSTKQYTISRRFSKARQSLLLALAQWSQDALHISLTSDVLKHTTAVLEEWLARHYCRSD